MVVHFPDLALRFTDEVVVTRAGERWVLTTHPSFDSKQHVYVVRAELSEGDRRVEGWFRVAEQTVQDLEADGDLRVFALREIKRHLDHSALAENFSLDLSAHDSAG